MAYTYTSQREIRRAFWTFHPDLPRHKIPYHSSNTPEKVYSVDTRCAFVDYIDYLARDGQISDKLASHVTLS